MKIFDSVDASSRITRTLLLVILALVCLSVLGQMSKYFWGHPKVKGFVPAFYVDYESNVTTWYSSLALCLSSGLFAAIAAVKCAQGDSYRRHWVALAAIFLCLSIDEVAMLHEYPIAPLREYLGVGGLLYYTWVIPGMLGVALFAVAYARFLQSLPTATRRQLLFAGATFIAGAIGVEMLSGAQADQYGEENFGYAMIVTVEEFLEMLGIAILIKALLEYINAELGGFSIQVRRS